MRDFVVLAHDVPLEPTFSLDDLPGTGGRIDICARAVTAALLVSHGIREDTTVWVVIQDTVTLEFRGRAIRQLHPDERSTAARFRDALAVREDRLLTSRPIEASPGIFIRGQGLEATLAGFDTAREIVLLDEDCPQLSSVRSPSNPVFVLSDHHDFTAAERDTLEAVTETCYSLGPVALQADQAIVIAHNLLDRGQTTQ